MSRTRFKRSRLGTTIIAIVIGAALSGTDRWIDRTELPDLQPQTSVTVSDRHGRLLRAYTTDQGLWRLPVDMGRVDKGYLAQLIGFEDKRFFRHHGVDPVAMIRAGLDSARAGRVVSGGSTLTMQVARLLEDGSTGRWSGKLRQVRVALALERRLGKAEILNLYLHLAPYGGNLEGVRAATLSYFGKEPWRLTPAEAALLVALPQSPETRRPDRHAARARAARDRVLARSEANGTLGGADAQVARSEAAPAARAAFPALSPHLADRMVGERRDQTRHRLTIDREAQAAVEDLLASTARRLHPSLSAAVLVADAATGEVLVSVGSPDYLDRRRQGFVDMTRARRSPGSTLKPLIYGLAFDHGIAHPESLIDDRPVDFAGYAPQNFDKQFRGRVFVREALQSSLNVPAVILLDRVGPAHLMAILRKAGARPALPPGGAPGLAIGLGGVGLSLEELVQIYQPLANRGQALTLRYRADTHPSAPRRILSPRASWYLGDILLGVPTPGDALPGQLAYKTGTSYGHRDVWAIGYDGAHVVGVWVGRADATPMPGALGVNVAGPILFDVFGRLGPGRALLPPAPPAALVVSNADLPPPLRQVRSAAVREEDSGPQIIFPPDGARLELAASQSRMVVKLRNGAPPFRWLVNGQATDADSHGRSITLPVATRGFMQIAVIDRTGAATRHTVFVD